MRNKLAHKDITPPDLERCHDPKRALRIFKNQQRILFFDPSEVYSRIENKIDPFKRHQNNLSIAMLFPKNTDGICRCGCGEKSKLSWASSDCSDFAYRVYDIISYGTSRARFLMKMYYGDLCQNNCGNEWSDIDHIIPVKHGGGGCWLSNFKPLCKECHRDKTNKDFGYVSYKKTVGKNEN